MNRKTKKRAKAPARPPDGAGDQLPGVTDSSGGKPAAVRRILAGAIACEVILPAGLAALALICAVPSWAQSKPAQTESTAARPSLTAYAEIPAGAQSVVSATLGKADEAYRAKSSGQGYVTENPANHLAAQYAADGVKIRFQNADIDLKFEGWGYGKAGVRDDPAAVAPLADANRVAYRRGALTEWYVNGPLGIEQGFTISQPPVATASPDSQQEGLDISLRLGGNLSASVERGGHALTLRDQKGVETLRYGTLLAYDASGRELESWMEVQDGSLRLRVNTAGARYPIIVDPWLQAAQLADGVVGDRFGQSVAVSGNTVVVGAPYANAGQGAAYVFVAPGGVWAATPTYTAELINNSGEAGDNFGAAVGISGNTVLVGAPFANGGQGAVYVFVEPIVGTTPTWPASPTYNAVLTAPTGGAFGYSVGINESGNTIVVGAVGSAAYVFVEPIVGTTATWPASPTNNAVLTAPTGAAGDDFAYSVGINESGNTIVVGAPGVDINGLQGAAYVFVEPTPVGSSVPVWSSETDTAELPNSAGTTGDHFGNSVGISGNTAVVGAPGVQIGSVVDQGAAYVFVAPIADGVPNWAMLTTYNAKLNASSGTSYASLGNSVGISGNTVVAGAQGVSLASGAAYVFVEPTPAGSGAPTWSSETETAELTASVELTNTFLGFSVGISGNTVVAGVPGIALGSVGTNPTQGLAYVFTSPGSLNAVYTPTGPIDFGAVQVNTTGTQQVIVSNPLGPAFTISGITLEGSSSAFTVSGVVCNNRAVAAPYSSLSITLAAGQTCTITLQFLPMVDENGYAEDLVFATTATSSNAAAGPGGTGQAILLLGDGVEPYASYTNASSGSPTQVTFGSVDENTPATQTLTLANTGDGPLVVGGTIVMPVGVFSYTQVTCNPAMPTPLSFPFTISAGGFCNFTMQFKPNAVGAAGGGITFIDNAAGGETNLPSVAGQAPYFDQSVQLSGTGISTGPTGATVPDNEPITISDSVTVTPLINTAPGVLFAGPAAWYSTSGLGFDGTSGETQTLTVSNVGEAAMALTGAPAISSGSFTISQTACSNGAASLPTTLPSGGACTFTILYTPVAGAANTGTIVFSDNAALSSPLSVQSGSNYTQTISLDSAGSNAALLSPPSGTVTIPTINEPIIVTDQDSVTTNLIITTAGTASTGYVNAPYTPIALFTASGGLLPYSWSATGLPPGMNIAKATGIISGTPTAAGDFLVTVTVTDSLGNSVFAQSPLNVDAAPAPIASLSPTSLTFAAQPSGTASAAQTVTLSNTGNALLNITGTGINISGANATDFSETNACGTSVAAGINCVISVTFTPSLSAGSETATLNVADNAGGTPQQVQLSGIALPPPNVSCTIPTINFSGDSATATFTCTATDFTQAIPLECNLPSAFSNYTCSFSPSSLNFTTSNTASTTLTIQPAMGASLERRSRPWAPSSGGVAFGAALWLPACVFVVRRKKGKSKRGMLWLLILLCGLPMISSCGGKKGPATPPAGTYQASIALKGPGLNETISFSIQVQ